MSGCNVTCQIAIYALGSKTPLADDSVALLAIREVGHLRSHAWQLDRQLHIAFMEWR